MREAAEGVNMDTIMQRADWTSAHTMRADYLRLLSREALEICNSVQNATNDKMIEFFFY